MASRSLTIRNGRLIDPAEKLECRAAKVIRNCPLALLRAASAADRRLSQSRLEARIGREG